MTAKLSLCSSVPRYQKLVWFWGLGLVQVAIALSPNLAKPSYAAERITVSLGGNIERSISVDSLEIYAKEGRITPELAPYIGYIKKSSPDALAKVRGLLSQRANLDVTTVDRLAYSPQGECLLEQANKAFHTGARLPAGKGLRGAAIVAAADQNEGLTLLNVIRLFPTPVLRVNLRQGLAFANQASAVFSQLSSAGAAGLADSAGVGAAGAIAAAGAGQVVPCQAQSLSK